MAVKAGPAGGGPARTVTPLAFTVCHGPDVTWYIMMTVLCNIAYNILCILVSIQADRSY